MVRASEMQANPIRFALQVSMGRLWIRWNTVPNPIRVKAGRLMRVRSGN